MRYAAAAEPVPSSVPVGAVGKCSFRGFPGWKVERDTVRNLMDFVISIDKKVTFY